MSPAPRPSSTANCSNSLSSLFTSLFTLPLSALYEFFCNLRETHTARHQQHKQVIDEIRHFSSQTSIVIVLRRNDRLRRFFAELLENLVETFFEKIRSV